MRRVAVALAKAGQGAPPMTALALGTANNIARSLRLTGSLEQVAAGIAGAVPTPLAIGIARAPWGDKRFVESVGLRVVAQVIRTSPARRPPPELRPDPESELTNGVAKVEQTLAESALVPFVWSPRLRLDRDRHHRDGPGATDRVTGNPAQRQPGSRPR